MWVRVPPDGLGIKLKIFGGTFMKTLYVKIDVQKDFAYGKLGTPEAVAALNVIREVNDYALENGDDVIHTQDTHNAATYFKTQEGKNLPILHTEIGTDGWLICPETLKDGQPVVSIHKDRFGMIFPWVDILFDSTGNCKYDRIVILGYITNCCVITNALIIKTFVPEIPIHIIPDACAGGTPELHDAALKVLDSCQFIVQDWNSFVNDRRNDSDEA